MIERSRPRATDELPPGVGEIIGKAIAAMFAAVNDILAGATAWHKVRGLGSLSLLAGFVLFVVFVVGKLA
jgi:hypothetical protein